MKPYAVALLAFGALSPLFSQPQPKVEYSLSFPNAVHHEARIRATFTGVRQPALEIVMSRSSPGRYAVHEFTKNISALQFRNGAGQALNATRAEANQWKVAGHDGTVVAEYTLFGDHGDGTYAQIDATHARLNMPATLLWAHGFEKVPVRLTLDIPQGSNWRVATQLAPALGANSTTQTVFQAPNLDRLLDSPIEISDFTEIRWQTGDRQFRLALHHQGTPDEAAAYAKAMQRITAEAEGVFGGFPTYDDGLYTFLADYLPYITGDGMEHRNSTVLANTGSIAQNAPRLLQTVAHEFFHSWNVERIRPRSLEPFDFEKANVSGELWFAEGFTNYYGGLILRRAGVSSTGDFESYMANAVMGALNAPGRLERSAVEMSREAAFNDGAPSIDQTNSVNTFLTYYTYGQALGLGIDLSIRSQFPGRSLDDWMRAMWREHPDVDKAYTLADLQRTLASVTNADFARNMFASHIEGKEPMDYAGLLGRFGMTLEPLNPNKAWLGTVQLQFTQTGVRLSGPSLRGSPLYQAGVDRGDVIDSIDGKAIRVQKDLDDALAAHKPGDRVKLVLERRTGKAEIEVALMPAPELRIRTFEAAGRELPDAARALRDAWLSSKAIHPAPAVFKYCKGDARPVPFEYSKCPADGGDLFLTPR